LSVDACMHACMNNELVRYIRQESRVDEMMRYDYRLYDALDECLPNSDRWLLVRNRRNTLTPLK
jgi:hypothetical protein